jgi:type II secretory pathway pseudopilin PulG
MLKTNRAFTLIEALAVVGFFLVIIAALTPFVKMARARAHRTECVTNLRRISLGLHTYASEHSRNFPPSLMTLYPKYLADEKAFDCPASAFHGTKDIPGYEYKTGLTEKSPARETIVWDKDGNHHKAGRNVLRVDGSVEWVR